MKTLILLFFVLGASVCAAQKPDWSIVVDEDIVSYQLSSTGTYLVYHVDRDEDNLHCVNVKTGKKLWSKTLPEDSEKFPGRFVDTETLVLGSGKNYEFIQLNDGKVLKTLPIIGDSWSDLAGGVSVSVMGIGGGDPNAHASPFFRGNLGIFYFDDGFQILDLKKQKVIHQSECDITQVQYEYWDNMVMVIPQNGCDSIYILDTLTNAMLYRMELGSASLNSRVLQHFAVHNDQMLLFNEDNILCINLVLQNVEAILPIDPEDPDAYLTFTTDKGLYLLTSSDNVQTLYNARDGSVLWATTEGAIPGLVDKVQLYNNGKEAVLISYNQEDGKVGAYKVDMATGGVLWSRLLFEQDGSYEPGHLKGSKTGALIGAYLLSAAANMLDRGQRVGSMTYRRTYYPNMAAIERGLYKQKSSEGYVIILDTSNTTKLTLAMGGHIYSELPTKKEDRDEYDGEGFLVLDIKDGKILEHKPYPIIATSNKEDTYNAVKFMTVSTHKNAEVVVGSHDVYVVRNTGIERFPFHPEYDDVGFISRLDSSVAILVENTEDNLYSYWVFDVLSKATTDNVLCARSTEKNFVFQDTTLFGIMVEYHDGEEIVAYPLMTGEVSSPDKRVPLWKLSEDDIDAMEIGSLENNSSSSDKFQGIRVSRGDVYLMGEDGLAKISRDGKCRWVHEWEVDKEESVLGLTEVGKYLVYSMANKTKVLANDCKGTVVGEHEIDSDDTKILTDKKSEIVVIDTSDGIIYGYHAK